MVLKFDPTDHTPSPAQPLPGASHPLELQHFSLENVESPFRKQRLV